MLNTQKLLYILPDVAYIAELLPGKKEHTFLIQSFRQINGEFIDENELLEDNVEKLISKLDAEEYHLILPDFLFTNTIVEVEETDDAKLKEHLKGTLLPSLGLSTDTHQVKTFVLTEHGGKSKVQLSALEKSLLNPISKNIESKSIKISAISPLSWTVKAVVSLEPSISIIQMGSQAYLAQHYIGIDQAISASVDEVVTLSESIKTLKGAEPSIQTVYLISNNLVEDELKGTLSDTLPLQQLASFKEEESDMPSYVKMIIETGMRTLSIDSFPVPRFELGPVVAAAAATPEQNAEAKAVSETQAEDVKEENASTAEPQKEEQAADTETSTSDADTSETKTDEEEKEVALPKPDESSSDLPKPMADATEKTAPAPAVTPPLPTVSTTTDADSSTASPEEKEKPETTETPKEDEQKTTQMKSDDTPTPKSDEKEKEEESSPSKSEEANVTAVEESKPETTSESSEDTQTEEPKPPQTPAEPEKKVIKNKSGLQPMLKSLLVAFVVFLITVGIGAGIGGGYIYLTQRQSGDNTQTEEPIASDQPSEEASPTPEPSPEESIDVSEKSILIVNATTKAGYAGESKSKLENADFGAVAAANAKGDYEEGFIVLMDEEDTSLIDALEEALEFELEFSDEISTEDPDETYDAVVVLAE